MARIVMKFGGTSVADMDRIRAVAEKVRAEHERGHEVVVVVSAMSGATNALIDLAREAGPMHDAREYDSIVATGEQVSAGLLAIALQNIGVDARSWLGWQVPVMTDTVHGGARIEEIGTDTIIGRITQGQVAVVAGFQGLAGDNNRITTLGRGGSDTSAVALAAALDATRCDIYTDVDGVYTTDPRIAPKARRIERITFEEMLEMASGGAKVLQTRSVAMAMRLGVNLQVRSSFDNRPGTMVVREEDAMEKNPVSSIACAKDEAKITLAGIADRPGVAAVIFGALAAENINVDMIVQTAASAENETDITFSTPGGELVRAVAILENLTGDVVCPKILPERDMCKVSVIGLAMRSQPGVASTMFRTLADEGINIEVIATSEIKISVLIAAKHAEAAVRSLHTAFGLDC